MDDIRNGACPLCHERGILVMPPGVVIDGIRATRYFCRSCGFMQAFLDDVHAFEFENAGRLTVIGDTEKPFR